MSKLFIINDFDKPSSRLVVVKRFGVGKHNLGEDEYLKEYTYINFSEATDLEDFGIEVIEGSDRFLCKVVGESKAKYQDGQPRQWQGESEFVVYG